MIYVGTFSERGSEGIYVYNFDRRQNKYELLQTIGSKESPSFVAISPDGKFLVSANREGLLGDKIWGSVSLFAINQLTGTLSHLHDQHSYGASPCHVSFHPSGRYIFLSHYQGGSFVVLPLLDNGEIGEPTAIVQLKGKGAVMPRQEQPHTHSAVPSFDGRFLYVSDLGLDKILIYSFDETTGKVAESDQAFIQTDPGAGPRHFAFSPDGELAFSSEEMSSTICSYKVDKSSGSLQKVQRLTSLPPDFTKQNSTADIHTSPDGEYVYISNRGFDGLAIFKILNGGQLQSIGFASTVGKKPRNFLPDPKGKYMLVANRDTDGINVFEIRSDGTLTNTGIVLSVPSPVCIKYLEIE